MWLSFKAFALKLYQGIDVAHTRIQWVAVSFLGVGVLNLYQMYVYLFHKNDNKAGVHVGVLFEWFAITHANVTMARGKKVTQIIVIKLKYYNGHLVDAVFVTFRPIS